MVAIFFEVCYYDYTIKLNVRKCLFIGLLSFCPNCLIR